MAEIVTPSGLVNELTVITDGDTISEVNVPSEAFNRKIKKSVDREYMQETLKDGTEQLNPRSFTSGRFDSQELVSDTLSVSGWYTIAETGVLTNQIYSGIFSINFRKTSVIIQALIAASSSAKTHVNSTIEILSIGFQTTLDRIEGIRIAKSDSVDNSGFKLQIKIDASSASSLGTQMIGSLNRVSIGGQGWELVTPFLDNTPTLPDTVTAGTFLEAGEEQTFEASGTHYFSNWVGAKITNDQLRCSVEWPEIPKQGTNIVITLPSTSLSAVDGSGTSVVISGSHTISNFFINGKHVIFFINETGVFTTLNTGLIGLLVAGAGCKLTIT